MAERCAKVRAAIKERIQSCLTQEDPGNTGGPQDPIAVVSMAREALRALKDAQVVESVTDSSHIASNVATSCHPRC